MNGILVDQYAMVVKVTDVSFKTDALIVKGECNLHVANSEWSNTNDFQGNPG